MADSDTTTTPTQKNISLTFTLIYLLTLAVVIFASLWITGAQTGGSDTMTTAEHFRTFAKQSSAASMVLYILAVVQLFVFIPAAVVSRFVTAFVLLFIVVTLWMFRRAMSTEGMSPYYETTQKLVNVLNAAAITIAVWVTNPGEIFTATQFSSVGIALLIAMAVFALLFLLNYVAAPAAQMGQYQRSLGILAGVTISVLFIAWITWMFTNYTGKSGWLSVAVMVMLVIIIGMLVVKTLQTRMPNAGPGSKRNAVLDVLVNTVLYVPCLFTGWFDGIGSGLGRTFGLSSTSGPAMRANAWNAAASVGTNVAKTPRTFWVLSAAAIGLLLVYIYAPDMDDVQSWVVGGGSGGGDAVVDKQLLNSTADVPLNVSTTVGSYEDLGGGATATGTVGDDITDTTPAFRYRYGISFWFTLDALAPNTNPAYDKWTAIFSYGNKPCIQYNARRNAIRVVMGDSRGDNMRVVFEGGDVRLQKWINMVVNYDGGTVDVFMDGKLLKSSSGIAPYMTLDNVVVGSPGGLYGTVCNAIYQAKPYSLSQVYYLYYLGKSGVSE